MQSVHQNIRIVFSAINMRVKLFRIVAAVALDKSEQIDLVAEIRFESFLISFYFFDKNIQNSFCAGQLNELILGFPTS